MSTPAIRLLPLPRDRGGEFADLDAQPLDRVLEIGHLREGGEIDLRHRGVAFGFGGHHGRSILRTLVAVLAARSYDHKAI